MLSTIVRRQNDAVPSFVNDLFNDSFLPRFFETGWNLKNNSVPAVNVEETDKEFNIEVAAPGLERKDLKISVNDGVLTISSEKKTENQEKTEKYVRREFGYTSFTRSFTLPEETDVEKIEASHKNGVLHISVPKAEARVIPSKEIKIS
jgi:HSP20 family protein